MKGQDKTIPGVGSGICCHRVFRPFITSTGPFAEAGPPQVDLVWVGVPWLAVRNCRLLFSRKLLTGPLGGVGQFF